MAVNYGSILAAAACAVLRRLGEGPLPVFATQPSLRSVVLFVRRYAQFIRARKTKNTKLYPSPVAAADADFVCCNWYGDPQLQLQRGE